MGAQDRRSRSKPASGLGHVAGPSPNSSYTSRGGRSRQRRAGAVRRGLKPAFGRRACRCLRGPGGVSSSARLHGVESRSGRRALRAEHFRVPRPTRSTRPQTRTSVRRVCILPHSERRDEPVGTTWHVPRTLSRQMLLQDKTITVSAEDAPEQSSSDFADEVGFADQDLVGVSERQACAKFAAGSTLSNGPCPRPGCLSQARRRRGCVSPSMTGSACADGVASRLRHARSSHPYAAFRPVTVVTETACSSLPGCARPVAESSSIPREPRALSPLGSQAHVVLDNQISLRRQATRRILVALRRSAPIIA